MSSELKNYLEIIPAILSRDKYELTKKLSLLKDAYSFLGDIQKPIVQIDVCDGVFVPTQTWNYLGGMVEDLIQFCDDFAFEIDLLVAHPKNAIAEWQKIGAQRIVLHIETLQDYSNFFAETATTKTHLRLCEPVRRSFSEGGELATKQSPEFGFALSLETPMKNLTQFERDADFFQFMGIDRIGYQGEKFNQAVLKRIEAFSRENIGIPISVDGGVNLKTGKKLIRAGANRLVVGSAIFGENNNAKEIAKIIKKFKNLK